MVRLLGLCLEESVSWECLDESVVVRTRTVRVQCGKLRVGTMNNIQAIGSSGGYLHFEEQPMLS